MIPYIKVVGLYEVNIAWRMGAKIKGTIGAVPVHKKEIILNFMVVLIFQRYTPNFLFFPKRE
jgi:hypothetical protein